MFFIKIFAVLHCLLVILHHYESKFKSMIRSVLLSQPALLVSGLLCSTVAAQSSMVTVCSYSSAFSREVLSRVVRFIPFFFFKKQEFIQKHNNIAIIWHLILIPASTYLYQLPGIGTLVVPSFLPQDTGGSILLVKSEKKNILWAEE